MTIAGSLALTLALALATAAIAEEAVPPSVEEVAPPAVDVVLLRNGDRLSGTIVVNDYDTEPAEDKKKNDFRYLGQIGYEF